MKRVDLRETTLPLAPLEAFRRAQVDVATMSFGALRDYVQRLGASGYSVTELRVDLHRKIAFPAAALIMTLLAVPFGATTGRRGALYLVGLSIVLAAAYFLLTTFFMAIGAAGILPPFLAAWATNILFGAAALYLVLGLRT
jgi:lipopolysaccharide export system permease protein